MTKSFALALGAVGLVLDLDGLTRDVGDVTLTLGQDEASCLVYGMLRACAEMGVWQRVVSLAQIPQQILRATRYRKQA